MGILFRNNEYCLHRIVGTKLAPHDVILGNHENDTKIWEQVFIRHRFNMMHEQSIPIYSHNF